MYISLKGTAFSCVANHAVLLTDLQFFELVKQLIYCIRSFNCFLCAPQAHHRPTTVPPQAYHSPTTVPQKLIDCMWWVILYCNKDEMDFNSQGSMCGFYFYITEIYDFLPFGATMTVSTLAPLS